MIPAFSTVVSLELSGIGLPLMKAYIPQFLKFSEVIDSFDF